MFNRDLAEYDDDRSTLTCETTELVQQLIRNACVNDGTVDSGHEVRNAETIVAYFGGSKVDWQRYEPKPNRVSVATTIDGADPSAPSLLLMGHTDVVPVSADRWRNDPFGGEVIDGELWGRGTVDMLNLTGSMAVAVKHLVNEGFRPKGTLRYLAVADEEANSHYGAEWLTANHRDEIVADYVITETGGIPLPSADGLKLPVLVGEKGMIPFCIRASGTPSHASQTFRVDNALVVIAEVAQRIATYEPPTRISDVWRCFVEGMSFPAELSAPFLDPDQLVALCESLPIGIARQAHAATHTTFAPTILNAGTKLNVTPDSAELMIDVRTLGGDSAESVTEMIREALGDIADQVEIEHRTESPATTSSFDTPLRDSIARITTAFYAGSKTIPFLSVGATDARHFRRLGSVGYGFGLFSENITLDDFAARFHGDNERIDVESLGLSTAMWIKLIKDFLG